jgi:hypothetical protein
MKRFRRLPTIEQLEVKRLKAADLAECAAAHGVVEVTDGSTSSVASGPYLSNKTEQASATSANLTSEESEEEVDEEDESDESNDTEESETDESESSESEEDESEESESEEDDSDESDDEDDSSEDESDSDESDDSETDEDDESESEEDDSDDSDEEDESDDDSDDEDESDDDSDDDSDEEDSGETELSTELTATSENSGTGKAEFESETDGSTTNREFELKVNGATTSGALITGNQEVRVGGVLVGNISLTDGNGELKFSDDPDDDETEFPSNFPTTIDSTTVVAIGPENAPILTGTFGTSSNLQSLVALQSLSPSSVAAIQAAAKIEAVAIDRPSVATQATVQNVTAGEAADENLLDAGFAAVTPRPDANLAVRYDGGMHNPEDQQDIDAALEALAEGEIVWTV